MLIFQQILDDVESCNIMCRGPAKILLHQTLETVMKKHGGALANTGEITETDPKLIMKSLKQVGIDGLIWLQSRVLGDGFMFQDILKINLVNSNKRFNHSDDSRGVGLICECYTLVCTRSPVG